jgi:hypothetical protein
MNMVVEYCQCVMNVIDMTSSEMTQWSNFCVENIQNDKLKKSLGRFGPNLGLLLQWIDTHNAELMKNVTCPFHARITRGVLMSHDSAWTDLIKGKEISAKELSDFKKTCETILDETHVLLTEYKEVQQAVDQDYSSYSDYSESDTTSEEDDEAECEEDEEGEEIELEKQPRRYFRRHR